jgi:nickel-dependent lactate racemase
VLSLASDRAGVGPAEEELCVPTIDLAFGRLSLPLDVPAAAEIVAPRSLPAMPDEEATLVGRLRSPLAGPGLEVLARGRRTVGISICDNTRPYPLRTVLPPLLGVLGGREVTLFVATGSHRAATAAELREMLGEEILGAVGLCQHDARRSDQHRPVSVLPDTGVPAALDARFLDQDLRLTLGLVEPHFFAGFSGGPKMVAPGLASLETIMELHSPARIAHPRATWGQLEGNPVHEGIRHVAAAARVDLSVEITVNRQRGITGVFAGPPVPAHAAGCAAVRQVEMVPVAAPFDLVVTTNGGYPLDQNLYQTVKGMSAAAQIVKPGGAIVVVAECSDGFPSHGRYRDTLAAYSGPGQFLAALPGLAPAADLWQVQVHAQIASRARVFLHTAGLDDAAVHLAWLEPAPDLQGTVDRLLREAGAQARVAVLPRGPYTIPYLSG